MPDYLNSDKKKLINVASTIVHLFEDIRTLPKPLRDIGCFIQK